MWVADIRFGAHAVDPAGGGGRVAGVAAIGLPQLVAPRVGRCSRSGQWAALPLLSPAQPTPPVGGSKWSSTAPLIIDIEGQTGGQLYGAATDKDVKGGDRGPWHL